MSLLPFLGQIRYPRPKAAGERMKIRDAISLERLIN